MPFSEEQRQELARRKQAAKERREAKARRAAWEERLRSIAPLTSALKEAGAEFEVVDLHRHNQRWLPLWIPWGYSEIPWELAPSAEFTWHERDWQGSADTAAEALGRLAAAEEPVLLIYERPWLGVRLARNGAAHFMDKAIEAAGQGWGELWVTHPAGEWIIRLTPDSTLVCLPAPPPPPDVGPEERRSRREAVRDLFGTLASRKVRYRVRYPGDRFDWRLKPRRVDWKNSLKSINAPLPQHPSQLVELVEPFLKAHAAASDKVHLHVGGTRIDADAAAFLANLDAVLACHHERRPMLVTAEGADWQLLLKGKWVYAVG